MNTLLITRKMRFMALLVVSLVGCVNVANALAATPPPTIDTDFVYFNGSLSDFTLTTDSAGTTMITSSVYDLTFKPDSLAPAMPYIPYTVMLPADRAYHGFYYSTLDEVAASNVTMAANPIPVPTSQAARYSSKTMPKALASATLYPAYGQNVEYVGNSYADGHQLLHFLFCPFSYNATTRQLIFHNEISLEYEFYGNGSNTDNPPVVGTLDAGYFRSFVYNKDAVESIMVHDRQYTLAHAQTMGYNPNSNSPKLDYLIVTDSVLVDAFMPLIEWKRTKGLKADIVTTQHIYRTTENASDTPQLKIKKYLRDRYYNNDLKYVLLGGDAQIVPAQGCYAMVYGAVDTMLTNPKIVPTDLFYACMTGNMNWDNNGNGIAGEAYDVDDLESDIILTRAAVRDSCGVEAFVYKTVNYEKYPSDNLGYYSLFSGCKLHWINDSDYPPRSDAHEYGLLFDMFGMSKKLFYDTFQDVESDNTSYKFTPENIINEINKGYRFIDVSTHGWIDNWSTETTLFTNTSATLINNPRKTIITTSACHTNAFDSTNPCLSEVFISSRNSGIIGYFGSSRSGLSPKNKIIGLYGSHALNDFFYKAISPGPGEDYIPSFGIVSASAKSKLFHSGIAMYSPYTPERWLLFTVNPIGDPEMQLYSSDPMHFYMSVINYLNGQITVIPTMDALTCVKQKTPTGYVYDSAIASEASPKTFPVCSDAQICLTRYLYAPEFISFRLPSLFIQNRLITESTLYQADTICIGTNVSSTEAEGPVSFVFGDNIIKSHKVEIKSMLINRGAKVSFAKRD